MQQQNRAQLEKALEIALAAHRGQVDKSGEAYILHPLRLFSASETDEERIVALLHDVVEDSDYTLDDLRAAGFSNAVVEAVGLLTRKEEDVYEDFIARIKSNELTRRVKLMDLKDNMRIERIPNPTEKDFQRVEKYKKAVAFLESK